MDTHNILTLDLGRFNSVLFWCDPTTRAASHASVKPARPMPARATRHGAR